MQPKIVNLIALAVPCLGRLIIPSTILSVLFLNGCMGSAFLKRGTEDGKGVRETPSLHSVPARPTRISAQQRENMVREMEEDFNENSKNLQS